MGFDKNKINLVKSLLNDNHSLLFGESIFDKLKVDVDTVDILQDSEKLVILLSTVRVNERQEVGFASHPNRMNVTVTRARKALIVFGKTDTLSRNQL